jgi:hypothetical protein
VETPSAAHALSERFPIAPASAKFSAPLIGIFSARATLVDEDVRLYSLDELTETVRLLERSQPGPTAAELSNAVFAELAMKRSRRAVELVAEAIRRVRAREPRGDIGGSRWQAGIAEVRAWALRAGYEIPADCASRTRGRGLQRDTSGPPLLTLC